MQTTTRQASGSILALSVLLVALLLAACSGGGLTVTMDRGGSTVTVTIKDETGLIRSASGDAVGAPDPLPPAPAAWNPNGELTQVAVYWQSTACSEHPTLDLSGNALLLTIDPGPMSSGCTDTALVANMVTLTLGAVTDVTSITVRMVSSG